MYSIFPKKFNRNGFLYHSPMVYLHRMVGLKGEPAVDNRPLRDMTERSTLRSTGSKRVFTSLSDREQKRPQKFAIEVVAEVITPATTKYARQDGFFMAPLSGGPVQKYTIYINI